MSVAAASLDPRLVEGFRLLGAGRVAEAAALAAACLRELPEQPLAWHLAGVVALKQERAADAREALTRAAAMAPGDARVRVDLGNALLRCGALDSARSAYADAERLRPGWSQPAFNQGTALRHEGRWMEAAAAFARAAGIDPQDFAAMQACVDCVAEAARGEAVPDVAPAPHGAVVAPMTIVFCSRDATRSEAFAARVREEAAAGGHELMPIVAPRSLAEAYNAGARDARHDRIVFVHDDVTFLTPAPLATLSQALDRVDVAGLAGSRVAAGPAVLWSGHPHLHGWVSYPSPEGAGFVAAPMSLAHGLIDGMQTLDGLLIAARRAVARTVGFDARTFDAFHFYDLDFSLRAARAGHRVAVTTDVLALHASHGDFGPTWQAYGERFRAKFPELAAPAGRAHWYAARLPDTARLLAFHSALASLSPRREPA